MPTTGELPPFGRSLNQVVPRIKHRNFLKAAAERVPDPMQQPVWKPFVADMILTYAYDTPEAYVTISERELERLGVKHDELRKQVLINFNNRLPQVQRGGKPPIITFHIGMRQDACLLLVPGFWNGFASQVPGRPVVAPATRDVLLVTTDRSEVGLNGIRQISAEARQRDPVHTISEALLCWDQGNWHVFEGPPAIA